MRLTLRTLLAYLDDILEPAEAKEIGNKLGDSSLASSLVSRIREVMRRRRLTAPSLSGSGVGIDPNTVAEYLDNTLPPDGVADVEKICLESDVHLAEVAACHQVLTLALGEPIEVSQKTRERMYALGPSADRIAVASVGAHSDELPSEALHDVLKQAQTLAGNGQRRALAQVAAGAPDSFTTNLPDYLRPGTSWKKVLGGAAAAVFVVVWAILALEISPFKSDPARKPIVAASDEATPQGAAGEAEATGEQVAAAKRRPRREIVSTDPPSRPAGEAAAATEIDLPPPQEEPESDEPVFQRKPAEPTADEGEVVVADEAPAETAEPEKPPVVVQAPPARYPSQAGLALHFVPADEGWYVLPGRWLVQPGELLAVPEPYQGTFELQDGSATVLLGGKAGTAVRWLGATAVAPTGIELRRGQVAIRASSSGPDGAKPVVFAVGLGDGLWKLELKPGAICGVELLPLEPSQYEQPPTATDFVGGIYVSAGEVVVTDPTGKATAMKGPTWLKLPPGMTPQLLTIPEWLSPQSLKGARERVAGLFEKEFNLKDRVELSLPASARDKNPQISRLATGCLGLIEAIQPLIAVLQRTPHDESRRAAIVELRQWLPTAPENRELLRKELAQLYTPDDAEVVYRLLWGFNVDDLRGKDLSEQLLEWMDHSEVSIRELAFYQVARLTGKTHEYRASAVQRQSALRTWERHVQKEGALLPPIKDSRVD
ncbi:MAG: hypothetical protein ACT4QC_09860 [Planctomycetaceae bacterium]